MDSEKTTIVSGIVGMGALLAEFIFHKELSEQTGGLVFATILAVIILVCVYLTIDGILKLIKEKAQAEEDRQIKLANKFCTILQNEIKEEIKIQKAIYVNLKNVKDMMGEDHDSTVEQALTEVKKQESVINAAKIMVKYSNQNSQEIRNMLSGITDILKEINETSPVKTVITEVHTKDASYEEAGQASEDPEEARAAALKAARQAAERKKRRAAAAKAAQARRQRSAGGSAIARLSAHTTTEKDEDDNKEKAAEEARKAKDTAEDSLDVLASAVSHAAEAIKAADAKSESSLHKANAAASTKIELDNTDKEKKAPEVKTEKSEKTAEVKTEKSEKTSDDKKDKIAADKEEKQDTLAGDSSDKEGNNGSPAADDAAAKVPAEDDPALNGNAASDTAAANADAYNDSKEKKSDRAEDKTNNKNAADAGTDGPDQEISGTAVNNESAEEKPDQFDFTPIDTAAVEKKGNADTEKQDAENRDQPVTAEESAEKELSTVIAEKEHSSDSAEKGHSADSAEKTDTASDKKPEKDDQANEEIKAAKNKKDERSASDPAKAPAKAAPVSSADINKALKIEVKSDKSDTKKSGRADNKKNAGRNAEKPGKPTPKATDRLSLKGKKTNKDSNDNSEKKNDVRKSANNKKAADKTGADKAEKPVDSDIAKDTLEKVDSFEIAKELNDVSNAVDEEEEERDARNAEAKKTEVSSDDEAELDKSLESFLKMADSDTDIMDDGKDITEKTAVDDGKALNADLSAEDIAKLFASIK
jgi:hypothetical protein